MKRAALYVRVSTQEQKLHGFSVDNQIEALREYCKEKGYKEIGLFNDAGISAHISYKKRPAIQDIIKECQAKNVDIILFTKLDRFFRSVPDYYAFMERTGNTPWKAIWQDFDTETSAGQFNVNIMLACAQAEAEQASERVKAVNAFRRANGFYTSGKAPTGYVVHKGVLSVDESKREGIKAFFDEYLSSFNLTYATQKLHDYGIMVRRDTACRMLHNTTYYGDAFGVTCEPFISKEEFDVIQNSISANKQRNSTRHNSVYIFTGGILRCEACGTALSGSTRKMLSGKNVRYYKYYRCPKHRNMACSNSRSTTEMNIERYLLNNLEDVVSAYNRAIDMKPIEVVDSAAKIELLEKKLERIGIRYEDGDLTTEEYRKKRDDIKEQIASLNIIPFRKEKKTLPDGWKDIYNGFDASHKRAFWYRTISKITLDRNGNLNMFL